MYLKLAVLEMAADDQNYHLTPQIRPLENVYTNYGRQL